MKSGFVSILGRPNVGKSTLLNAILNQKVSIVADRSQTTRNAIKGIYNKEGVQIVFTDTPGIHKPKEKLSIEMNNMAYSAAHDVDVNILVVDASEPFGPGDEYILNHLDIKNAPLILVFNKIDMARLDKVLKIKEIYQEKAPEAIVIDTVAKDKFNVDTLLEKIIELLPEGPAYYSTEEITDKVIFLLEESMRYYLKNLKVNFMKNPEEKNINEYSEESKIFILEQEQNYSSLDAKTDLFAVIKSHDLINDNKLIVSFEFMNKKYHIYIYIVYVKNQ